MAGQVIGVHIPLVVAPDQRGLRIDHNEVVGIGDSVKAGEVLYLGIVSLPNP